MGRSEQGIDKGNRRYKAIPRVLVFLTNKNDVLLLKGAGNKPIWPNLYNGVGGHVETGESVRQAAVREVREETGLEVENLTLRAITNINAGNIETGIIMYVFVAEASSRETVASVEGSLHWRPIKGLEELELVEDLYWLLPRILRDDRAHEPLSLHYSYDEQDQLVIRSD